MPVSQMPIMKCSCFDSLLLSYLEKVQEDMVHGSIYFYNFDVLLRSCELWAGVKYFSIKISFSIIALTIFELSFRKLVK